VLLNFRAILQRCSVYWIRPEYDLVNFKRFL
jgi:hypothetical protein